MEDVPINVDNNCHPFIKSVDYAWAKFLQVSKMSKKSIGILFCDSNLTRMRERVSYKKGDEIQTLLTELLYSKVM